MSIVKIEVSSTRRKKMYGWDRSDCHSCAMVNTSECASCIERKVSLMEKETENAEKRAKKHLSQLEEYFRGLEELEKRCGITSASAIEWQIEIDGFIYHMDSHNNPDSNVLRTYVQDKDKEEC